MADAATLRILAVEDNLLLARALRVVVHELGYELLPVATDAPEALRLFDEYLPDLVLLDVKLRGEQDGIEVGHLLNAKRRVPIIFVTSFQDRETFDRAKQVGAYAFLTKPYDARVLERAIELAMQHFEREQHAIGAESDILQTNEGLFLRVNGKFVRVLYNDLMWAEADDSYCHIYTVQRKYTQRIKMRELDDSLPAPRFLRVHRGYMVQLSYVEEYDPQTSEVRMRDGATVPVGRAYRAELLNQLNILRTS